MSITPDEMASPEAHRAVCEERDELREELERAQRAHYNEKCRGDHYFEQALNLTAEKKQLRRDLDGLEAEAARLAFEHPILAQLLELARRGVVPSEVTLCDLRRLEGVGLVEWRDGAYWATEVSRG